MIIEENAGDGVMFFFSFFLKGRSSLGRPFSHGQRWCGLSW